MHEDVWLAKLCAHLSTTRALKEDQPESPASWHDNESWEHISSQQILWYVCFGAKEGLRLWMMIWHACRRWINNTKYHRGGLDSDPFDTLYLLSPSSVSKTSQSLPTFVFLLFHPQHLFQVSFVSIVTRSCPMYFSSPAGEAAGEVSFFPNKQQPAASKISDTTLILTFTCCI